MQSFLSYALNLTDFISRSLYIFDQDIPWIATVIGREYLMNTFHVLIEVFTIFTVPSSLSYVDIFP